MKMYTLAYYIFTKMLTLEARQGKDNFIKLAKLFLFCLEFTNNK